MKIIQKITHNEKAKAFLYDGKGDFLRPVYSLAVYSMMQGIQVVHLLQIGKQKHPELDENVTAVIKTFLRPKIAKRCIRSLRQVFNGRIIVVDDSPKPLKIKDSTVDVLALPFNSGISVGRNSGIAKVKTKYTLLTDDDAVFTCASDWKIAYDYLEANPEIDGIAATLIKLPKRNAGNIYNEWLYPGAGELLKPVGEIVDGYPVVSVPVNLFLARTESLRKIPWDNNLKIAEHRDYFSAAAGKLIFVQSDIPAYHVRTPWNKKYMKYRNDTQQYIDYANKKWFSIAQGIEKPQGL